MGSARSHRHATGEPRIDFDPRTYGFHKLSDLGQKTNAFDIDHVEGKPLRIRVKQASKKKV